MVEVRVGSGVFVVERPVALAVDADVPDEGEGPFELLRARNAVEGETAALAARSATDAEVAAIEAQVVELARLAGAPGTDTADREFHLAIARATHNGPLLAVVEMLWDRGRGAVWKQMEKHFETPELRAATHRAHRAVPEAIRDRNGPAARKAMRAHLAGVAHEFTHGWRQVKRRRGRAEALKKALP
jgi:GntR family uxuAB operon transcriptional repressor